MGELTTLPTASAIRVNPGIAKPVMRKLDKIIETAAALQRWDDMERAIDFLIECQQAIVDWWTANLKHGGSRRPSMQGTAYLKLADAERETGYDQTKVSRWRTALEDVDTYRERLMNGARRNAERAAIEPDAALRATPSRDGPDFWPTPPCLTHALVRHVVPSLPPGAIWECAAGDGRLARAIASTGREVIATDIDPQGEGIETRDFIRDSLIPENAIIATNPPYNYSDKFLARCLELFDGDLILGFVLLLRHDHLQASGRVDAFNRATFEVHCNWRPIWIDGTDGQPRWSFHWIAWTHDQRQPPIYVREGQ